MTPEERIRQVAGSDSRAESALRLLANLKARAGPMPVREVASVKVCGSCGRELDVSAFGPDARALDGLRSRCRECEATARRRARGTPRLA